MQGSIYFMVDGADNMDNGGNTNAITSPSLDTIEEVKVLTAGYSAEFGGRSGALINVVTKSGTREFRGSAYEFFRNDRFILDRSLIRARRRRLTSTTRATPSAGRSGRRFADEQAVLFLRPGLETNHQGVSNVSTVPTMAERSGDFRTSSLAAPRDPVSGQPFPDRTVPASRFSPNGRALLAAYPAPNFGGPGGNYLVTATNETDSREEVLRVDYVISPRTQATYRFTHNDVQIFNAFQGGNTGIVPGTRPRPGWTTVGSVQQTLSNALLNSVTVSATKNTIAAGPQNETLARGALGLTYPEIYPLNRFGVGPDMTLTGFTAYNTGDYIRNRNLTYQVRDDLTWVRGAHALKFGTPDHLQPEGSEHPAARQRRGHVRHVGAQFNRQRRRRRAAGQLPELYGRRAGSGMARALLAVRVLRSGQLAGDATS